MIPLSLDDTFNFTCSNRLSCFNGCCRNLNQFLTPYDIVRLKNRLGITSGLFLERYTFQHTGPESGLPIVTLSADNASELQCPFVSPSGCSVYEDRPSSCRMYPLIRAVSRSRETGETTEHYMLLQEPHCLGFQQAKTWTIPEWIDDQKIIIYNEMNDLMMDIIALKNRLHPDPLDNKSKRLFHMACYDLDTFRNRIFAAGIPGTLAVESDLIDSAKDDDTALLRIGIQWIKYELFGAGA